MGTAVRASVASNLVVVGTIEPVNDASASFQVAGHVASVTAVRGAQVTAGETLASLDTTALSESLSSAELSLQSDDAKLTEDENSQTSSAATATTTTTQKASTSATGAGGSGGSGSSPQNSISQGQAALVADQATSSADQQQEAADLAQAKTACGISTTTTTTTTTTSTTTSPTTPSGDSACTTALQQVSTDQQAVATDQRTVASDESALAKAITQEESSSSGSGSTSGNSTSAAAAPTGASGTGATGSRGNAASGSASDSAAEIASDEAAIDTARSNVIVAEQSLAEGQLTSPINGTIVSVGINVGDTVSADSATEDIVIIGTKSFEATATLTSAQVPSVKVGAVADVTVDGTAGTIGGTVAQVGPVQSSSSGYSYPVVVLLPPSANNLFSGSSANLSIVTGAKHDVLAIPTSAVTTTGTQSFVQVLSGGNPVDKPIKIGIVGSIYTQVLSGLHLGDRVVLANYADPVPASNSATLGGFAGGFGGTGGFGGGTFGSGGGRFTGGGGPTKLGG